MTGWAGGSQPAWALGRVNAGASSLTFQNGLVTATAVRNGVGSYSLSWPATGTAMAYVQLTCSAFGGGPKFANHASLTATGMNVLVYSGTGGASEADFNVRVDAPGA